jgi:hypothetical protein
LENPQLVAFCLILIMGIGNYCGTRHTMTALLYTAAVLGIVVSLSEIAPGWLAERFATRFWCSCLMIVAIAIQLTSQRPRATTALDQLWFDFFDTFGIVWGRRIQDRVNFQANKEGLPIRLELDGFESSNPKTIARDLQVRLSIESNKTERPIAPDQDGSINTEERLEQILRWLLRRFVDPGWIDKRLNSSSKSSVGEFSVDS